MCNRSDLCSLGSSLLLLSAVGCESSAASQLDRAILALDFQAAEAYLSAPEGKREASSNQTLGGLIATAAIPTFGPIPQGSTSAAPLGLSELLVEMKAWQSSPEDLSVLFPNLKSAPIPVFVVATGHPDGDAYVRRVAFTRDGPSLDEAGEPVVVLNANVIAHTYPGTAKEQANDAFGVLRHESFHVLYKRYRLTPEGSKRRTAFTPEEQLWELVLDEGIGHFLDMGIQFPRDGFPIGKAEPAVKRLVQALAQLRDSPSPEETEILLRQANQGTYWDKYGSISGMLFAYVVHQELGVSGLRSAIQEGPHRLMRDYQKIAIRSGKWPRLPDDILP